MYRLEASRVDDVFASWSETEPERDAALQRMVQHAGVPITIGVRGPERCLTRFAAIAFPSRTSALLQPAFFHVPKTTKPSTSFLCKA